MNREKRFAFNTIIIAFGKACTQLVTFLLLPLYTSILTTAEYGTVDLLNTLVGLGLPIMTLQLEQGVFRYLIENREKEDTQNDIIKTAFITIIRLMFIFVFIFIFLSLVINNKYKYYLFANVIAYIFPTLFLQVARGLGKNKEFSIGSFISAFSTIIYNIIFVLFFDMRVEGMMLGTLLGQITCSIYFIFKLNIFKYLKKGIYNKSISKELIKYSIPLIPNSISWWIFNASDRIIVSILLGLSFTGLLSAANKFSSIYVSIYSIIYMSWTESISAHIDDDDIVEYFTNTFNEIIRLFLCLSCGLISYIPILFKILINTQFSESYFLIPILIIASFFNVMVGLIGSFYVAKKNTKSIAKTSIFAAIINIVVHLLLIKFIGLYAAAISTFVSYFCMTIYRMYDMKKRYFKINIKYKELLSTLLMLTISIIFYYLNNKYTNIISIIMVTIFAIVINKNILKTMINSILKRRVK